MQATESNGANAIEVRIQGGKEQGILMAQAQSPTIAFAPNPKCPIDDQAGMEKPTRNTHFQHLVLRPPLGPGPRPRETPGGSVKGEGGLGHNKVGHRRWIETDFLDAAAELARRTLPPREELDGCCGVVGGVCGVEGWGFCGA